MRFQLRPAGGLLQPGDPVFFIILSLLAASVLTLYPLPQNIALWRPDWILVTCFLWIARRPDWCSIWFAFFCGLLADLLTGSILGQHAFALVIVAAMVRLAQRNKAIDWSFPTLTLLFVGVGVIYWATFNFVDLFTRLTPPALGWQAMISSLVVWPLVYRIFGYPQLRNI